MPSATRYVSVMATEQHVMSTRPVYPMFVHLNDLKLADVVELFEGPFGTAVVTQITADELTFHRPYGVTGDFSYTGGVPYSVGNEVCKYLMCDARYTAKSHTFKVWQRKDLR